MRTFNSILGKRNSVNAFNSLSAFILTESEMKYVRGGLKPNEDIEPNDLWIPIP